MGLTGARPPTVSMRYDPSHGTALIEGLDGGCPELTNEGTEYLKLQRLVGFSIYLLKRRRSSGLGPGVGGFRPQWEVCCVCIRSHKLNEPLKIFDRLLILIDAPEGVDVFSFLLQ